MSRYDLFISYSRRDNAEGRITQLVEHISREFESFVGRPLRPFFDITKIQGMQDWQHRILLGLRESHLLLACVSPSFLASPYCEWEFNEYLKHEVARAVIGEGVAPVYFVAVPGWEDKEFDQSCGEWVVEMRRRQSIDLRPWFEEGEDALRDDAVRARMGELKRQLADSISRGERADQSTGNVDSHNPHFIGRVVELRRLREAVALGKVGVLTAVHGLGGVGKTALAIEYAHAFAHEYGGGRWQVRCEGCGDLRLAIAKLAPTLGVEFNQAETRNLDLQFDRIIEELRSRATAHEPGRCLLLLDNVDQAELLEPAQTQRFPASNWLHVLATTRLGEDDLFGCHQDRAFLAVDELPEADALELIESYQPGGRLADDEERGAAQDIARLLGGFTLAIEVAAVFLGQFAGEVTCAGLRDRMVQDGLGGLESLASQTSEGVLHGEKRLTATLRPTFARLGEKERLALTLSALLPADHIAVPWIRDLLARDFPEIGDDADSGCPDPWRSLLRSLFSLRLWQATGAPHSDSIPRVVRIHRLVQSYARRQFQANCSKLEHRLLERAFDASEHLEERWFDPSQRWEVDPLVAFTKQLLKQGHSEGPRLTKWVCQWLPLLDGGSESECLLRLALATQESRPDVDVTELAITLSNLGAVLNRQARYSEAEPLLRRALAIDERHRDENHPFIAIRLSNLGSLLSNTNRLQEAEPLYRRALSIREKSLGPEHPVVAKSRNNLAALLHRTQRREEAESLLDQALAIREQSLGPEHPETAESLCNRALLATPTDAEPLYRRSLAIREESLGPEHPDVAHSLNCLAVLIASQNRCTEAESLLRRALEIREKSLGPEHPDVATTLNDLAVQLFNMHRPEEAVPNCRRALAIREGSLGQEHPAVAHSLETLATLLASTNQREEAEQLRGRARAIRRLNAGRGCESES